MNKTLTRLGKWLAVLSISLAVSLSVSASLAQEIPPEQLALARKYIDLTNKGAVYEVLLVETAAKTSKLFTQSNPEVAGKINDAIGKVLETYKGKNDELFDQFARVYATTFTQEELQQIVDFYSTPTGQKLASKALDVNKGIGAVMKVYGNNLGSEFVAKVRAELKAEGINL